MSLGLSDEYFDVEGRIVNFNKDDVRYSYMYFDTDASTVDLSEATSARISFTLSPPYTESTPILSTLPLTLNLVHYQNLIVIPVFPVVSETSTGLASLFWSMTIDFYNADQELIYTLDLTF